MLLSKLDANNKGASYTYTADGKLLTRTWARTISGAPLSTSYTYTPAGQLLTTDYSDTTPDVSIRYDRLGRQLTQSNGLATSTFAYDPATLALDTETITYDLNADGTADFTRVLDRSSDDLGRDKGFQLKNGSTVENEAKYGYHATTARLTEISNPQISNLKFTYDYVGNSSLIDAITGPVHSVDLIWEPTRNVLEKRENRVAGNMISGYQYRVNELGQRTGVTQTGSVFAAGQAIAWGYDALGQVTSADHTTQNTQDRAYRYDTIGNRLAAEISNPQISNPPGPNTSIYTANTLNQYTAVGSRAPTHDDDGNLRLDGGVNKDNQPREYVWDAENRLISVKRVSDGSTLVSYLYDSQSRRIARTQGSATTLYLYDAWNCIAEYSIQNSTFTLQNSRLWGLDLSGTLQGAGGVGGMLCESQISNPQITNYYPTYDGNGNISEYLAQTGAPAARFEYDPFGNTVVNTDATNQFAYRFSTKPADAATGLYYYGYRYYDPVTGRWPSRDPIEERGGVNLCGFVGNDALHMVDILGLFLSVDNLIKGLGPYDNDGDGVVDECWCEKFAKFIDNLADSVDDYDDFQEAFYDYADDAAVKLAKQMNAETGVSSKQYSGSSATDRATVGLQNSVIANGANNARHFSAALYWGHHAARLQGLRDRVEQFIAPSGSNREQENKAEVESDRRSGKASTAIEDALGKDAPWSQEDEESDAAWKKNKRKVAEEWRKKFCKCK